jgi:Uma2 family endonuclease
MSTALSTAAGLASNGDPRPKSWTCEEFYRLAELGCFRGQRAELIEGEIMVLSPQRPSHTYTTDHVAEILRNAGWPNVWVRMQLPIDFSPYSEPEPDVSVVAGCAEDYKLAHPSTALLIVEVSDSTLEYDQTRKASLYALKGVMDYWIVNLVDGQLEVRRKPQPDSVHDFGYGYASLTILREADVVTPLAAPTLTVAVADLLQ